MADDDLAFSPALKLADMVRERSISPVELVELYLGRIEQLDPQIGAYITVAADEALAAARTAEAAREHSQTPIFHGVPIAIKDLNDTAGIRTTHGSALFAQRVPDRDEACVARLKQGGFIILGKSNTPEFGYSFVTEPPAFHATRNPWDLSVTPGGSSGGAAAAVAAALAPIAQGSDAGGSIRVPSSFCGVFGIKPSRGRVSNAPQTDQLAWQNGPIARTVADAAAMLDLMAGYEVGDLWWAPPSRRAFLKEMGRPPRRLKIAVSTGGFSPAPAIGAVLEAAASLLADLGHSILDSDPDSTWAMPSGPETWDRGIALMGADLARYPILPPINSIPLDQLDPLNRALLEAARSIEAADYGRYLDESAGLGRRLVAMWKQFDVLLTPVVARPPLEIGYGRDGATHPMLPAMLEMAPYTSTWNVTGQPAVSVPFDLDPGGIPIGIQLVGPPAGESILIRLAAQIEEARPWAHRRPTLAVARGIAAFPG